MTIVRHHSGVDYSEHSRTPINFRGTLEYGETKITVEGPATVETTKGSYKYGRETQICLLAVDYPKFGKRNKNNGQIRLMIAGPLYVGLQWLQNGLDDVYNYTTSYVAEKEITKLHEVL